MSLPSFTTASAAHLNRPLWTNLLCSHGRGSWPTRLASTFVHSLPVCTSAFNRTIPNRMASVTAQGSTMTARFLGTFTDTFRVVADAATRRSGMFDARVVTAPNKNGQHFFSVFCVFVSFSSRKTNKRARVPLKSSCHLLCGNRIVKGLSTLFWATKRRTNLCSALAECLLIVCRITPLPTTEIPVSRHDSRG